MKISDNDILDSISRTSRSMSEYQLNTFVIKSQVTDYKQVRQILLELSARYDSLRQLEIDLERRELVKNKLIYDISVHDGNDEFEKNNLELNLRECIKDIQFANRNKLSQEKDYNFFADQIKNRFKTTKELEEFILNPEQEKTYWIARMGKQAAIDILSLGRISVGNMDSIAMMDEDDQVKVFSIAVQYSGLMSVGLNKLQQEFQPYLKELVDSSTKIIPTFTNIEDNLNVKLIDELKNDKKIFENFQFTHKPQA